MNSNTIAGVSKRHFRRLVAKQLRTTMTTDFNNIASARGNNNKVNQNIQLTSDDIDTDRDSDLTRNGAQNVTEEDNFHSNLRDWCVKHKITRNACDDLLIILRNEGINLPLSAKTLLKVKGNRISPVLINNGQYYHFGLAKALKLLELVLSEEEKLLEIDIGIDGLPLFKSSGTVLWPILGAISNCANLKPFLIGAFVGQRKPDMINEYLSEFVKEIKNLNSEGLQINEMLIKIKIRVWVCDAPARAFVTGTVGHTSADGCSKCAQKAERKNKRLAYKTCAGTLRTDNDFKSRKYLSHHNQFFRENSHILEEIGTGMISQFPLDVMHLIDLGVGKKIFTNIWKGTHNRRKLSNEEKSNLDRKLISMAAFIPKEFGRKPRTMNELCRLKAIEFRQLLLYTRIVIFKNVLDDDLYIHYLLLHTAYRLVSCPRNNQQNLNCVEEILQTFVNNFQFIYGEDKVSYNVHNLLHLTECVKMYGNVDSFSAYRFENYMQVLKKDCRKPTKILQQLHNRAWKEVC